MLGTPELAFLGAKDLSAYELTTQEGTDTELTHFDGRPEDCDCWASGELVCWPCFRGGHTEPNPNAGVDE